MSQNSSESSNKPRPVSAFDEGVRKKIEKIETHLTIQNAVSNSWKIRGVCDIFFEIFNHYSRLGLLL